MNPKKSGSATKKSAACCEQMYVCPTSGETECLTHGGFDNCCGHPQCPGNVKAQAERAPGEIDWDYLNQKDCTYKRCSLFEHPKEKPHRIVGADGEFLRYESEDA